MLVALFFCMRYLIYVLHFVFATGAVSTTAGLLEPLISARRPGLRDRMAYRLPLWAGTPCGMQEDHTFADAIAECAGVVLAATFLLLRNNASLGWIPQDLIAVVLLLSVQKALRLPNLKVGTWLLLCAFCFDVFWVFLSPLIFKKSVMIEVATGGGTGQSIPMVLKIPVFTGYLTGQFKILGLGDVAIPGFLVSLLLRHDHAMAQQRRKPYSCCRDYFSVGIIGYACGLVATFVSLYRMKHGQPALLFLVPGTLLPTVFVALSRGELAAFWNADYRPEQAPQGYGPLTDGDKEA